MKITVFGASGAIGKLLVNKAIEKGYQVRAYVRNPAKINLSDSQLTLVKGELSDYNAIKLAIEGSDVVISALGPSMSPKAKGMPVLEGHDNIIRAMRETGVRRIITLATPSVSFRKDKKSLATQFPSLMAKLFLPRAYKEIVSIGNAVQASGLDWTIVRILAPKNILETGKIRVTFGEQKINFAISRADIARFMLEQVEDTQYVHSMPIIGS